MGKKTSLLNPNPEVQHQRQSSKEQQSSEEQEQVGGVATPLFRQTKGVNVGEGERYGSIITGLALILAGISRRGIGGLLLGGLGVAAIQRGVTGHCSLYRSMGVSTMRRQRPGVPGNLGIKVERRTTINRRPEEVFSFWRDFRNLSHFMENIERIDLFDDKHTRWVARGPGGRLVEWEAQIINEHPNQLIAWESLPGSAVQNAGSVRFEPVPGGRGTELRVSLEYNPPGGIFGALGAKLFGKSPQQQVDEDLWRLKQVLEAGEVATTAGQPVGNHKA